MTDRYNSLTTIDEVLSHAAELIKAKYARTGEFTNPSVVKEYLSMKLANYEQEVFAVMLLDNQNRLIDYVELFFGTINAASVYPREVVKTALKYNAAAIIFAHNHPSGELEPSEADKLLTQQLKTALALIDVRSLDHIIVGDGAMSFAERGLI